jgi:hypothetical protein
MSPIIIIVLGVILFIGLGTGLYFIISEDTSGDASGDTSGDTSSDTSGDTSSDASNKPPILEPSISFESSIILEPDTANPDIAILDNCVRVNCNGGTCIEGICDCQAGYTGEMCEIYDACWNKNIQNGGTCDSSNGKVSCTNGYSGESCETYDACWNKNIQNEGTCDPLTSLVTCKDGYFGGLCEFYDKCFGNKCNGNGTCIDGKCKCDTGYYGDKCETADKCIESGVTCQNKGTCDPVTGICLCADGYSGISCGTKSLCNGITCPIGQSCVGGVCAELKPMLCAKDYFARGNTKIGADMLLVSNIIPVTGVGHSYMGKHLVITNINGNAKLSKVEEIHRIYSSGTSEWVTGYRYRIYYHNDGKIQSNPNYPTNNGKFLTGGKNHGDMISFSGDTDGHHITKLTNGLIVSLDTNGQTALAINPSENTIDHWNIYWADINNPGKFKIIQFICS